MKREIEIFNKWFKEESDITPAMVLNAIKEAVDETPREEWVSVEDRLPDDGEVVIGYFPEGTEGSSGRPCVAPARLGNKKVISNFPNSTAYYFVATHWQPLPSAPGKDENKNDNL